MSARHFVAIVLIILGSIVHAEDQQENFSGEIIVTATGIAEDSSEIPSSLTVITSEEIEDSQQTEVSELLRRVPGLIVMQSGGTGGATSIFSRGTESDHTLVMLDGVRLNSPYFGGYDLSLLSTAGVERIEVVRGPYSALWGSGAVGGVINILPARAAEGFHGRLFAEGGSDSWQLYEGAFSFSGEHLDLIASGIKRSGDMDQENSDFDFEQGMLDTGWNFGKEKRLGLLYQDLESELGIPFSSPGFTTPLRRQNTRQKTLALPFRWKFNRNWRLEMTASHVERDYRFSDPDDPWGYTSQQTQADTDTFRVTANRSLAEHTLSFGGEWREDVVSDKSSYGPNLVDEKIKTGSLFFQDDWKLAPDARLLVGIRWDDTDEWGSEFSSRMSLGWAMTDGLDLLVGYGEAFRQPSVGELYFPGSGNPQLLPENSQSWEIGFSTPSKDAFHCGVSFFYTSIDDLIQFDFPSFTMKNIGEANIDGVEFTVQGSISRKLSLDFQISRLDTENVETGENLLRRPEWSGAFSLHGNFFKRLRGDLTLLYVGERLDIDATTFATVTSPGFFTVDLALSMKIRDQFFLKFRGSNLLNREYSEINGYPSPGRRLMAGLGATF